MSFPSATFLVPRPPLRHTPWHSPLYGRHANSSLFFPTPGYRLQRLFLKAPIRVLDHLDLQLKTLMPDADMQDILDVKNELWKKGMEVNSECARDVNPVGIDENPWHTPVVL